MQHWKPRLTGIILSILWAASCPADDRLVLQLRWDHQFQFAGYYAAKWQGYYAEEGLEVEIRSALTDDGRILSAVEEVASGRADFGIGAADILKANEQGPPLSVVATIFQQSAAAFYLKQSTPFRSLADLTTLRVARRVNSLIDVELQAILLKEGIDPNDVPPHEHQPGLEHLLSDRIQVLPGYRTSTPYHSDENGRPFREILPADYGVDFYGDSLFTRAELTQKDPALIEKFVRAGVKGWQYALDHPEEMVVKISRDLPRRDKLDDLEDFNRFQVQSVKKLMLHPIVAIGNSNPERWRRMHSVLKSIGQVEHELNLSAFIFDPERFRLEKQQRFKDMMFWLSISTIVLLGLAALWGISLKRQVAQKTQTLQQELSERRNIEQNVRDAKHDLDHAQKIAHIGNWRWELTRQGAVWSAGLGRIYGRTDKDPPDFETWLTHVHPDDRKSVQDAVHASIEHGTAYKMEYRLFRYDTGEMRFFEAEADVIRDERGVALYMVGTAQDISERKLAEDALRTNERLLRQIAENYPCFLSIIKADLTVGFTSGKEFTKLGLNPDDFTGLTLEQIFREQAELVRSCYQQAFAGQEVNFELSIDNQYQHYTAVPLYDEEGNIPRILAVVENITERKEAEKELQQLNRTLEAAQKMAKVGYWSFDIATQMPTWSEQMFVVCGYDPAGGVPAYEEHKHTWHPDDWEMFDTAVQGCAEGRPYNVVVRIIFPDGSIHYVNTQGFPHYNEQHEITELFGTSQDITELKQAEARLKEYSERLEAMVEERTQELKETQERLLRQEKLAVLGQLSGSVAHELRHPLGVLSNAAYFLKMTLTDTDETTNEYLEMMSTEIYKSDKIISDLLDFSRNQLTGKLDKAEIQVSELISAVLAEHPPPETIELSFEANSELPPVYVDAQQIKQVLTNMIVNAYQAMPDGGSLSIGSKQLSASSEESLHGLLTPERCLLITVKDTGCGIGPENLKKLFEPLFTTKSKGIGLGLAISKNLIEANGGGIRVESEEGNGSTFTLMLPTKEVVDVLSELSGNTN